MKHLSARSCISAISTLTQVTLLKGSPEGIRGLAGFCMNDSAVTGKQTPAPSATTATGAHAAWGCPPDRSVCLSCWLGTAVWPFCLQERGEQPLSSNCCENSVGKPERSFHSRTHPGKNPPNKPTCLNERPSGLKHRPVGQNPDDRKNIMRRVVV